MKLLQLEVNSMVGDMKNPTDDLNSRKTASELEIKELQDEMEEIVRKQQKVEYSLNGNDWL